MLASLKQLNSTEWQLVGKVSLADLPALVTAFTQDLAQQPAGADGIIHLDLSQAEGGSALVALLLNWLKQAQAVGLNLNFTQPTESLNQTLQLTNLTHILL